MRAVLIKDEKGPLENLYLGETPKPVPGPGEVLVKAKQSLLMVWFRRTHGLLR